MDYYENFPKFYENEFIRSITNNPKWTISGRTSTDQTKPGKIPLDMYALTYQHVVKGASTWAEPFLITLPELLKLYPNAANHAYHLDSYEDKVTILDIEPTCPQELKDKFLTMPYIYGEVSMSGKGYHLVFPLPEKIYYKYPVAAKKKRWIGKDNHYEFHFFHYVTFTRNMLPPSSSETPFEPFFEEMAAKQKEPAPPIPIVTLDTDDIPGANIIISSGCGVKIKKPEDYPSMSQYECGCASRIYRQLLPIIRMNEKQRNITYSFEERTAMVYTVLKKVVPYREKHDTQRHKMPWLLYLTSDMIARIDKEREQQQNESN